VKRDRLCLFLAVACLGLVLPSAAVAAPSCGDMSVSVEQGAYFGVQFRLPCNIKPGATATYAITQQPQHGTLSEATSSGYITYTPTGDYMGPDSFRYTATDAGGTSTARTVSITVTPPLPPTCQTRTDPARTDHLTSLGLYCQSSPAAGTLTHEITRQPEHGTLIWGEGGEGSPNVRYRSDPGFVGNDSFAYRATNSAGTSEEAVITIEVSETYNQLPQCWHDGSVRLRPGRSTTLRLWCWDSDYEPFTVEQAAGGGPAHGTVTLSDLDEWGGLTVTYTADAAYEGTDVIELVVKDGFGASPVPPISVEVVASTVNTAPECYGFTIYPNANTGSIIGPQCVDAENDPLTYSVSDPEHGTAFLELYESPPHWVINYTPDRGYSGPDSFTFTANDGQATSAPATMDVQVQPPVIGPPECAPADVVVRKNHSQVVNLGCTHLGESMRIEVTRQPEHGTLVFPEGDGPPLYMPDRGHEGADSFEFTAINEIGSSQSYTQTLLVGKKPKP
jgi:large repetitive protein